MRAGPADIRSSSVSSAIRPGSTSVRVERGERGLEPGDAERRRLERHVLLLARVRRVVGRDRPRSCRRGAPSMQRGAVVLASAAAGSSSGSGRASAPPRRSGTRWCGVASPLAAHAASRAPRGAARPTRARRGASGGAAARCRAASESSRATQRLSPSDGQPPSPSSAETAPMCMCPPRVSVGSSQWSASGRPVIALYSSARRISPAVATGRPSSVNAAAPASASSPISVSCVPVLAHRDRGREPDRDLGLVLGARPAARAGRRRVDDGIGVRHREDRAVAARRGRGCARRDRLLVLAAGRAQVDVRVDERRREHEARAVDRRGGRSHRGRPDRRDRAAVDADVEDRVDALGRIEDARAANDEVVGAASSDDA